jgi:phosphoheptose isomerase
MLSSLNLESVCSEAISRHLAVIEQLDSQRPHLERVASRMSQAALSGHKILWCGNGGSASDAQHLATELVGRFRRDRPGLASLALTANAAAVIGIANDFGFHEVFARQVEALCAPGDVVVGISTSGTSRNITVALLAMLTAVLPALVLPALWPAYAEAHARQDYAWMRRAFRIVMRAMLALNLACGAVFIRFGKH